MTADAAAAPDLTDCPDAAADHFVEPNPVTAAFQDGETFRDDDIGDVHEIFYYARRLINEQARDEHRFRLDVTAFMEAIEEMPLFLRRTA